MSRLFFAYNRWFLDRICTYPIVVWVTYLPAMKFNRSRHFLAKPRFNSGNYDITVFFVGLNLLTRRFPALGKPASAS